MNADDFDLPLETLRDDFVQYMLPPSMQLPFTDDDDDLLFVDDPSPPPEFSDDCVFERQPLPPTGVKRSQPSTPPIQPTEPFLPPGFPHPYSTRSCGPSPPVLPPTFHHNSYQQFQSLASQMMQPSGPFCQLYQNTFPFPQTRPKIITLIEGFVNPVKARQPGGKDNVRVCLPKQVVELNRSVVPPHVDPTRLAVRVLLLGGDRETKEIRVLKELCCRRFSLVRGSYFAVFDDLVVSFSSHMHGLNGKLKLRFNLIDLQNNVVDSIESQGFLTITKRGLEKQRQRVLQKQSQLGIVQVVHACRPPIGLTNGNLLVRIHGEGFTASPLCPSIVTFGDRRSREIISVHRNMIVCETPHHEPGMVNVNVSLDGRSFLPSQAHFLYVSPSDQEGLRRMMTNMIQPDLSFGRSSPGSSPHGSMSGSDMDVDDASSGGCSSPYSPAMQYEFRNFAIGAIRDYSGANVLHHAAARDYFELLSVLIGSHGSTIEVDGLDHFGRTPFMWALSGASLNSACLLLAAGARFDLKDAEGESVLHLVAKESEDAIGLKTFLFYFLKMDDKYQSRTRLLRKLIASTNQQGLTPAQVAVSEEVAALFAAFDKFCRCRLSSFAASSIQVRSGQLNGTVVEKSGSQPMEFQFLDDRMVVSLDSNTKAAVINDDLAFIILAKAEERVEFTLHRNPRIFSRLDGSWVEVEEDHVMKCLSFHVRTTSFVLQRIHRFFGSVKRDSLFEFKPWAFVWRSERVLKKQDSQRRKHKFMRKQVVPTHHVLERKIRSLKEARLASLSLSNRRDTQSITDV